jgi:predicted enzyme related to lactoylglutathione lyase
VVRAPGRRHEPRARFYAALFGWQFQAFQGTDDYFMTYEGGGAIQPANGQKGALVHFGTDDSDASVVRVRELGGEASDAQEIPGIGRYARCSDTEGNPFGLCQAAA